MERAGRLIPKLKLAKEIADPEIRARAAWVVAAGKKIARHTRATALVRDSLIVEVGDAVWQRQLATLETVLVRNVNKALGEAVVKHIDFRPMPARRGPQRAESARGEAVSNTGIEDPILDLLYRQKAK
jgi:predicted nucleic acid-binding Zn ribbon protein